MQNYDEGISLKSVHYIITSFTSVTEMTDRRRELYFDLFDVFKHEIVNEFVCTWWREGQRVGQSVPVCQMENCVCAK